jgi:sulfate transport system permease protein
VLPGFGRAFTITLSYVSLVVLLPLAVMVLMAMGIGWSGYWTLILQPRVLAAFRVSLVASGLAAGISALAGLLIAWVLSRYRFPGRRLADALLDLPFALPTAVAGISLAALYSPDGWIGHLLVPLGIRVAFTPPGILIALTFISLPFVVRSVQQVLEEIDAEQEEAATTLGASGFQIFRRITLPAILPSLLTGTTLAFARAIGEYGSVIFIAGNQPMVSEIVPLLIVIQLEQYDYRGAAAIGTTLLGLSFLLLFLINRLQRWARPENAA